ncbi:hypothetical protein A2U01_0078044, partial [Trifolium medium]|nr:hypothetical protein [Trifolium medium]
SRWFDERFNRLIVSKVFLIEVTDQAACSVEATATAVQSVWMKKTSAVGKA